MDDFDKTISPRREHISSGADDVTMPGKRDRKPDGRFSVGDLIMNRYKVLAELGQGGMGVVYKCFDETAGIEIALKALPPELSHNTLEMEDIKDNFQLVHNLHHPNIASSNNLERDNTNGNYYLIMECCEGEDLRRWIRRKRKDGELKLEDVLPIVKQVADALDYAHEQKIIHRDIKPGNIMIDGAGKIKILDFGLAAQIHTSMTRVSMACHGTSGTGPYMAPEQWEGRAQGAPADQYALAVMTYEMLAGHLPFESTDAAVLREAVLKSSLVSLENIPKYADAAIARAMSKDSAERFTSCSDFAAALSGKKIKAAKKQNKGGSLKWAAGFILLILLAAGGTGYYFFDQHQNEQAERGRLEAERKKAEEQKRIEELRKKAEEQKRLAEERKKAEEQKRLAEEQKKAEEQKRLAEEQKKAEEQKRLAEEQKNAEEQKLLTEERKQAEEQKRSEDQLKQAEKHQRLVAEREKVEKSKKENKAKMIAIQYIHKKDYSRAIAEFKKVLPLDDAENLYLLGLCYEGTDNITTAQELMLQAARKGHSKASFWLGQDMEIKNKRKDALSYYLLAIKQGNKEALLTASLIYLTQESELKNESKGIYYMELAAKANIPIAQYNLGCMYAKLKGFEFDSMTYNKDKAIMWFEKAAQNNIFPAKDALRKLR